jgi:inorganic phosphate transporter, PiT family
VGAVFGVGFFREWDHDRRARNGNHVPAAAKRIAPEERRRRKLVRRSHFLTIIAAWVITVPAAALLSGIIFLGLSRLPG